MFVPKMLEKNSFMEKLCVDTLIYTARNCDFSSDGAVRYRTVMEMISPDVLRESLDRIIETARTK